MKRILFIDSTHPLLRNGLEEAGFSCDYFPNHGRADYLNIIHHYHGIIIRSKIILDRELLDLATSLIFIGRVGAGMESIDVDYARSKGIHCLNSPEGNRDALAEHATGMLLALTNKLLQCDRQIRNGIWQREENRGSEILGKTVAIIGYGNMGSAFAQRLSGFGCRVIAYDKYKKGFANNLLEEVQMEEVFNDTDILSLHVPLTDETRYLVNFDYLMKFRKNIYLINTSRGPVVETAALAKALALEKVLGAALDVIEYEETSFELLTSVDIPAPMQFLIQAENVILSPHIAGWTNESKVRLARVLLDKIRALFPNPENDK
jgi:D-3-phosphoglycerate dehydrogenase / 2-oxoglutarate reductase